MEDYQHLLTLIRQGDKATIQQLYKDTWKKCRLFISAVGGTLDDAKDLLQDGMFLFFKKVESKPDLKLTAPPWAFVMGIIRRLWKRKVTGQKEKNTYLDLDDEGNNTKEMLTDEAPLPDEILSIPPEHPIIKLMDQLGKDCKKVLVAFYVYKQRLAEIAEDLGFTTKYVKQKRFRCARQLRNLYSGKD